MKVQDRAYVAIDYKLTLEDGEQVDASEPGEPLGFVWGAGQIIPGLEAQLEGLEPGDSGNFAIEPADGYGERREDMTDEIPREAFPAATEIEIGATYQAMGPHGPMHFQIVSYDDEKIVADFNHPLAGKRLNFEVKVAEVRAATDEELAALEADDCGDHECHGCGRH